MIRRRTLLASSIALPFAAQAGALAGSAAGARAAIGDAARLRYVVLDEGVPVTPAAVSTDAVGAPRILRIARDITPVYQTLDQMLAAGRFAIAGETTANAFFVLERLGWDRGLTTLYRGDTLTDALAVWQSGAEAFAGRPRYAQMPPSRAGLTPLSWLMVPR